MNKFILFGIVLLIFFSLTNNVKASPWGLPRCGTWGDIGFGCCNDVCELNARTCDISGNYLIKCADYDTFWDWDQCYEWPPDDESYWDYCSYGCRNSACWNTNPCDIGDACIQGDTRCGSTQRRGVSVEAVFQCEYNDDVGCWLWGIDPIDVCDPPSWCGSSQCVDYDQGQESQCSRRQTKCIGNFIQGCEDPNMDNIWTWETNPDDWYPCEFGCSEETGRGMCINREGEIPDPEIECIIGQHRCNPGFPDYNQICGLDYKWVIDPDPDPDRYCEFGCHLGSCNREPDPEILCYNCTLGTTRCAGRGDYVRECAFDPYTGCLAWVKSWPCESGRCENGICVERTKSGYRISLGYYMSSAISITTDGSSFYISGKNLTGNWSIYKFTLNGSFTDTILGFANDQSYSGLSFYNNELYGASSHNASHVKISKIDSLGNPVNTCYIPGSIVFGFEIIDGIFYLINNTVIGKYTSSCILTGTICGIDDDLTECVSQYEEDMFGYQNRLYILVPDWDEIQMFGIDGYFYGTMNVSEIIDEFKFWGGTVFNNNFYYLLEYEHEYPDTEFLIETQYFFTACSNECFDEATMCGGFSNNYIIPCVQDANDCWKWYQGDWTCTLTGTCNTTQCVYGCYERWENHRIKKAYCESSPSCEDICEPGAVSCSEDGKYVRECEYRNVWTTYENEILPIGGQCWTWEDFSNWENCGWGDCIDGHCVQSSKCTVNETKCFAFVLPATVTAQHLIDADPDLIGTEHIMTCRDVNNDSYYEWDIYSMDFCQWGCNETIVNATTDQSIATCINASGDFVNIKNTIYESSVWMGIMFSDPISKYMLILIINMLIFGLFTVGGQWEFGLLGISTVTIMASLLGWMPFEVIIIGIVFSGVFIYSKISGGA